MYSGYYPYRTYPVSSSYFSNPYNLNSEYFRALADEHAARDQVLAAQRAEEEARQRAARARAAAQRAYASPYNSYLSDDYDDYVLGGSDSDDGYSFLRPSAKPQGFGSDYDSRPSSTFSPYGLGRQQRLADQRRRELAELERARERERMRLEETRRARLEEERKRRMLEEERRRLEEDRLRRLLQEEQRRAQEEEIRRRRQTGLEPLFFGLNPIRADDELSSSPPRVGRIPIRGQTASPSHTAIHSPLRTEHSSPKSQISHLHTQSNPSGRSASVPPRPSPKHTQSSQARPLSTQQPQATSTPQEPPKPSLPAPTPEQLEAASKVFEFYRSAVQRRRALTTLRDLRARFLGLRSNFTFPAVVDFECPAGYDGPTMGELGGERYVRIEVAPEVTSIFASGLPRIQEEDALVKSAPKLAYTPVNAPLHSHEEELNRLLGALDAVESHGIARVRDARRRLVRAVEHEAERLEKWREAIWATFVERRTQQPQPEQKEEVAAEETTKDVEKMVLEEPKLEETQFEEMQPADASQPEAADSESPGRPQQEQDPAAQPEGVSIEVIEPDEPKHTEDVDIEPEPVSAPVPVNEDFIHPESSVAATADADMKADEPEQGVTVDVHTAVPSEAVSEAGDDADIDIDGDNEGEGEQMEVEESVRVPEKDVDAIDAEPIQLEPGPAEHEMEVEPQEHADSGMPTLVNTTVPSIPGSPYPSLLEQPAVTESASEPVLSTFVPSPTPTPSYPSIPIYTTSNSRSEPADVDVDVDLELDTETEAETERGPSTPPPASAFGYPEAQSPVVVVSPAGSYREQFALGNEDKFLQLAEPPKEHIETAPAHPQSENQQPALSLVDRDWKEVEGFDMF